MRGSRVAMKPKILRLAPFPKAPRVYASCNLFFEPHLLDNYFHHINIIVPKSI